MGNEYGKRKKISFFSWNKTWNACLQEIQWGMEEGVALWAFVGGFKDKVWTKYLLCKLYILFVYVKKETTYGSASIDLSLAT